MSLPETLEIVMILPFEASRWGSAAWINETVPLISVPYAVSQASGVFVTLIDETLETTTSIFFSYSTILEIHAETSEGLETSTAEPEMNVYGYLVRKDEVAALISTPVLQQK